MAESAAAAPDVASGGKRANPIARLLVFAGGYQKLTVLGCVLSAVNALLTIGMLVCVWFVVRDLIQVAPD